MSVVGLFAGIGGFEKAFREVGYLPSLLSDNDPAAQAVLRDRFPEVRLVGDVHQLKKLPRDTEIVTAGFPCQNLSMAGDKDGLFGTKSNVVDEMFRLIEGADAPTVVIENVYFMLHLKRGAAMSHLVSKFEKLGYGWAYRVIDTNAFGLPQRRRRVYFVASKTIDPKSVLFADDAGEAPAATASLKLPLGFYWTEGRSGFGLAVDGIPPLKGGSGLGIPSAPAVLFPDGKVLTPGIRACERLQGFPAGWTSAASAIPKRPQGRLLGNAVSVPAAKWVASRLKKPGTLLPGLVIEPLLRSASWPSAAFNDGRKRHSISASTRPLEITPPSIGKYRDASWSPLSERALSGFVRRAHEGGLNFPTGFIHRLEAVLTASSALIAAE